MTADVAGENTGILLTVPIAPLSAQVLQENNGKGIKRFLPVSESIRLPDLDLNVQPLPKRRQTLKAAAKAKGQQKLLFRQV